MTGRRFITSDYISIILGAIEKTQSDPALLRSLVYDVARLSLGKHVLTNYRQLGSEGLQQQVHDLEAAINQVEVLAQKPDQLGNGADAPLLDGPASSPADQTAVTVRDSLGDAIFADAWTDNAPVVVRTAPSEVYRDWREPTEILQPLEIWEPDVGRGPKRTRVDFWWAVQLASAALIGVGIYAIMLARSDYFFAGPGYSLAVPVAQGVTVASNATGLNTNVAPGTVHTAIGGSQSLGFPLPTVYGVYAVSVGKLYELDPLPMRVPDPRVAISAMISNASRVTMPDGKLQFIIFRRDLVASAPTEVFVRVVARVAREMKFNGAGPPMTTDIDGEWAIRSKSYVFRVAPVGDNPEMIVLHPADPQLSLSAGRYALVIAGKGYDFTIDGQVTDTAQCLERSSVIGGMVYSECRTPLPLLAN